VLAIHGQPATTYNVVEVITGWLTIRTLPDPAAGMPDRRAHR
jgi:hypothetical protein